MNCVYVIALFRDSRLAVNSPILVYLYAPKTGIKRDRTIVLIRASISKKVLKYKVVVYEVITIIYFALEFRPPRLFSERHSHETLVLQLAC